MLKHYLDARLKVLLRRKFFTFISLFGISFTLLVLMVVTAHVRSRVRARRRRSRGRTARSCVDHAVMYGPHSTWPSSAGFKLLDTYARNLPGVERLSLYSGRAAPSTPTSTAGRSHRR